MARDLYNNVLYFAIHRIRIILWMAFFICKKGVHMFDYSKIIKTEENLNQFIYSYNWDDGFDIPCKILDEKECTLPVALLIFELADGYTYLETKGEGYDLSEWLKFVDNLYQRILNGDFKKGKCIYNPDLTKVQIYKLKKLLPEKEHIFITPINTAVNE